MAYENILVETRGHVGLITLNRPKALNALSSPLMAELTEALDAFEADNNIRAMVLTGSEKAFAAGADIKQMADKTYMEAYKSDMFSDWGNIGRLQTLVIAAVNGFALGGGCELAMMCDFIIAGESAKFGQPEITLGIIPGAGGTQRLTRAVGKAKAMEMVLTGKMIDAHQAEKDGLVARVVPSDDLLDETMKTANKIARMSMPIAYMCKETVNASYEMSLGEGLRFERRMFHSAFATSDQTEGMAAFVEKRKADFKHE